MANEFRERNIKLQHLDCRAEQLCGSPVGDNHLSGAVNGAQAVRHVGQCCVESGR